MRILVTNDDGVFAPGIAALARGLSDAFGDEHELLVVAPLVDHSGAGAAVGRVYERESIPYEAVQVHRLEHVPTFGIEGTPALAVILACIGGFGDKPDLIVSGINHGTNAGRSALHSGTIGATLTGAQFGVTGLAVSIAWSEDPVPWETPVALATEVVPLLAGLEPASVLNLNAPAVPLDHLRGVRHGRLGSAGLIRAARAERTPLSSDGDLDRDGRDHRPDPPGRTGLGRRRGAGRARPALRRRTGGGGMGVPDPAGRGAGAHLGGVRRRPGQSPGHRPGPLRRLSATVRHRAADTVPTCTIEVAPL